MRHKKVLLIVAGAVILVALASSGWVYNATSKSSRLAENNAVSALQVSFVQQYGGQAIIKQLVSPDKVYAALWTDGDSVSHVSWNIGGLWVTVWSGNPITPSPAPTPSP